MNSQFRYRSLMRLIAAWLVIVSLPTCQAQQVPRLTRHAKEIHKALTKYPSGSFLHLFLRNGTDEFGNLGTLSDTSFEFTNANTGVTRLVAYDDVERVYSGNRSTLSPTRHHHGSVGFLVIIGAAAVVGIIILATQRN